MMKRMVFSSTAPMHQYGHVIQHRGVTSFQVSMTGPTAMVTLRLTCFTHWYKQPLIGHGTMPRPFGAAFLPSQFSKDPSPMISQCQPGIVRGNFMPPPPHHVELVLLENRLHDTLFECLVLGQIE